jgi:hypothetical protein
MLAIHAMWYSDHYGKEMPLDGARITPKLSYGIVKELLFLINVLLIIKYIGIL